MFAPTSTSLGSSMSQHLHATAKILRDVAFGGKSPGEAEVGPARKIYARVATEVAPPLFFRSTLLKRTPSKSSALSGPGGTGPPRSTGFPVMSLPPSRAPASVPRR